MSNRWLLPTMIVCLMLSGCILPTPREIANNEAVSVVQNGPVVRAALRTLPTDHGIKLVLASDGLFNYQSERLVEGYETTLIKTYDAIIDAEPYQKVLIRTYTDSKLDRVANEHLTQMQADRIASYLWASGIARGKLFAQGMGARDPVSSNHSTTGQADNRRVEILIIK